MGLRPRARHSSLPVPVSEANEVGYLAYVHSLCRHGTCKSFLVLVLVYTVNDAEEARRLFERGIDLVFSDVPGLLRRQLAGRA